MATVKVRFDYFKIKQQSEEDNFIVEDGIFDISAGLKQISELENLQKETTFTIRKDDARIQKLKYDQQNNIWELQILRLRDSKLFTGLAKENGDFTLDYLEDGEKIGESTTVLYDVKDKNLLVQRNRNAMTPSTLQLYLNSLFSKIGEHKFLTLNPIIDRAQLDELLKAKYLRKINVAVHPEESEKNYSKKGTALEALLSDYVNKDVNTLELTLSVGRAGKKNSNIMTEETENMIREIYSHRDALKLKASYKIDDDTNVEDVDLLDDRKHLIVQVTRDKDETINHENVYHILKDEYLKSEK